jgi:signal peptidase I
MKKFALKQWVKVVIAAACYILFSVWIDNLWLLIGLPLVVDIYLTKYIPFTFWKKWKSSPAKKVMEWVDAIGFALIAVYFINTFLFQNYQIPSSSLEKTLLVGDFLFVSKVSYGARVPNTPLSFPLAQHTLPVLERKSYIDWPQWKYKRLSGFGKVKRNDIVVFNFPAGDTVPVKVQNPDYYNSCFQEGIMQMRMMGFEYDPNTTSYSEYANRCMAAGREVVKNNPAKYGEIVVRPVDRRENYVKRCVGLPGDVLQIVNNQIFINQKKSENPEHLQFNYLVETDGTSISEDMKRVLNISNEDFIQGVTNEGYLKAHGIAPNENGQFNPVYHFPLTKEAVSILKAQKYIKKIVIESSEFNSGPTYPLTLNKGWTGDNYGPIWIPQRGKTLILNANNLAIYERPIRDYEGNKLEVKEGKIFINGKQTDRYTFQMDYYWMMGDNRHKSADSRFWGFVPEDHVVGKPILVWLSLDKDRSLFDGGIRFKRIFTMVHK